MLLGAFLNKSDSISSLYLFVALDYTQFKIGSLKMIRYGEEEISLWIILNNYAHTMLPMFHFYRKLSTHV